jgi:hypothetical protein
MTTHYKFKSRVKSVKELKEKFNFRNVKYKGENKVEYDERSKGYFINLEGSWESLYVGDEKPSFESGQEVLVTISPVQGCDNGQR